MTHSFMLVTFEYTVSVMTLMQSSAMFGGQVDNYMCEFTGEEQVGAFTGNCDGRLF